MAAAPSPLRPASPGRGLTLRRPAAPARRRRRRRRRVHGPRPRRSSPAPVPQSLGASSRSCSSSASSRGAPPLRPRLPLGLPAAQRRRPPSIARRAPGVGPRTLCLAPPPPARLVLAPSEPGRLPQAPPPALPRRRSSRLTARLGTRHQRPPKAAAAAAATALAALVAAAGPPPSGLLGMRTGTPPPLEWSWA